MTELVAAADLGTLSTNVTAILVGLVGIAVIFKAAAYIRKALA